MAKSLTVPPTQAFRDSLYPLRQAHLDNATKEAAPPSCSAPPQIVKNANGRTISWCVPNLISKCYRMTLVAVGTMLMVGALLELYMFQHLNSRAAFKCCVYGVLETAIAGLFFVEVGAFKRRGAEVQITGTKV